MREDLFSSGEGKTAERRYAKLSEWEWGLDLSEKWAGEIQAAGSLTHTL